ncbi:MAG TPA: hypothetical protein VHB47_10550 [Thermoanaerobaculia bacterium]|jgi:hypothetical protein|nr:hypothetical protein [Thermoanaerobaculia bacterium]
MISSRGTLFAAAALAFAAPVAGDGRALAGPPAAQAPATPAASAAVPAATPDPQVLLGPVTREQVEAAVPEWVQAGVEASPDLAAARALAGVAPGAEVTVLLGTWCSDSRREISRLWRALDAIGATAGGGAGGGLPFTLTYIGVDEAKREPAAAVAAAGLKYVPTLIVRRDGREVGRIVESSPHGVESDLLALLSGKAAGLLTANPKLTAAGSAPPSAAPPRP